MVQYHHDLDSANPHLQAAMRDMDAELRAEFEHYLVAGAVSPDLMFEQLGPLLLRAVQAGDAVEGERDMLHLDEPEYKVLAALTEFVNALADRRRALRTALRPDLDTDRINAWVEALPPNPSREEQDRLYRKIVLGLDE